MSPQARRPLTEAKAVFSLYCAQRAPPAPTRQQHPWLNPGLALLPLGSTMRCTGIAVWPSVWNLEVKSSLL